MLQEKSRTIIKEVKNLHTMKHCENEEENVDHFNDNVIGQMHEVI